MTYTVLLQPTAEKEIESAYLFIRERSAERADRWYHGLLEAITTLEEMPLRCPIAPESETVSHEIRQLLHLPYRILFTVRDDFVHVLHVRHVAQGELQE